jgi:hypothetical protein
MPGVLPNTGQEISLGKIGFALGINPNATTQTALNATVGVGRNRSLSGVPSIASGSQSAESADFGGLQTPNDY